MKKILYLIAGANGSGKTTFARKLVKDTGATFLNADDIMEKLGTNAVHAGKKYFLQLEKLMKSKKDLAIETTLAGKNHQRIIGDFRKNGYEIRMFYVFLDSPEMCVKRVEFRVASGGHDVPETDIVRRFWRSKDGFFAIKDRVDSWILIYNGSPSGGYEIAASGKGKVIEIASDALYNMFLKKAKNEQERF